MSLEAWQSCVVCWEKYGPRRRAIMFVSPYDCAHSICKSCYEKWSCTCPLCRQPNLSYKGWHAQALRLNVFDLQWIRIEITCFHGVVHHLNSDLSVVFGIEKDNSTKDMILVIEGKHHGRYCEIRSNLQHPSYSYRQIATTKWLETVQQECTFEKDAVFNDSIMCSVETVPNNILRVILNDLTMHKREICEEFLCLPESVSFL